MQIPLIATGTLTRSCLRGKLAVVTGAGGGIGFEAARSLAWLGAHVVIAELHRKNGIAASNRIAQEFGADAVTFICTDVGSEASVARLAKRLKKLAPVDIVINNATVAPVGAVSDVVINDWDRSYKVNLRGPVLLARAFLPDMLKRKCGVFVCVSSAGAAPYMGPYEVFKTAQVELANTLSTELDESGVYAFTIGPGLIPTTQSASVAIAKIAPLYGKTVAEFNAMSQKHIVTAEAAGAGFAAAVALAEQFHGQEIGSVQALQMAGINLDEAADAKVSASLSDETRDQALQICSSVRETLVEQVRGWSERPLFERQWVVRDFRKTAGMPVEQWIDALHTLEDAFASGAVIPGNVPLKQLASYYVHLQELAKGYEKDAAKLAEHLAIVHGWEQEVNTLAELLHGESAIAG